MKFVNEENSDMQRIGVLGASFNPPTLGHQDVINQALPFFDEILLVPSLAHAFRKTLAPIKHRLAMLKIFNEHWQKDEHGAKVKISNIEETILHERQEQGPIYTYDVLIALTKLYESYHKPFQLHFILGPDIFSPAIWQKFYRHEEIEQRWSLFIAKENLPIHSTLVRELCVKYAKEPIIRKQELARFVGEPIADYIEKHHLYIEKESTYG